MAEIFLPAGGGNAANQNLLMVERGRGAFATGGTSEVYLAFTTSLKQPVAVKIIRLDGNTEKARKTFRSEMEAHSALGPSPFIIQYLGCYMYKHFAGVVMEYAVCGSLYDFLHHTFVQTGAEPAKVTFGTSLRNRIVYEIIRGIQFLHNIGSDQKAIHGDLKTSNILLTGELHAKIADLGCTKVQTITQAQSSRGLPEGEVNAITLRYTAPEVLERPRDKKRSSSDIYSFGVIVWEMWSGEIPYMWCTTRDDVIQAILGRIKLSMPHEPNDEPPKARAKATVWLLVMEASQRILGTIQKDLPLVKLFSRCLGSDYSRPKATDIVLNFPLKFSEVDAMQKAVDARKQTGDIEPTYPEQAEYLSSALDGSEILTSPPPQNYQAQAQHFSMPGPSHHQQQHNLQRPVDQQVFAQHSRFPNFTVKQGLRTFVNAVRGPQQSRSQATPGRSAKQSLSRKPSKSNERTVLLVGDDGVGKQWLINQWINEDPTKHAGKRSRRELQIGGVKYNVVALSGWKNCNPNKPVHLVLACFAIDNLTSLRNLPSWLNRVWAKIGHARFPVWVIALKEDLRERFSQRIIPDQVVQSVLNQLNPQGYQKCSARSAYDVEDLFDQAIRYIQ